MSDFLFDAGNVLRLQKDSWANTDGTDTWVLARGQYVVVVAARHGWYKCYVFGKPGRCDMLSSELEKKALKLV